MKKNIRYTVDTLGVYAFDGCIEDVISMLERFRNDYDEVVLSVDCDTRDNTYEINVTAQREETEQEYRARLAKKEEEVKKLRDLTEKKIIEDLNREMDEYNTYLKLKQKYE
jgi:hypothetical protein